MSIYVKECRPAESTEWDEIWQGCDYATYFHSREWAEVWQAYTGGKIQPSPEMVTFSDGSRALIPLSCARGRMGIRKHYLSSPAVTYGGWLSVDRLKSLQVKMLCDVMKRRYRRIVWRENPHDKALMAVNDKLTQEDTTHILDIKMGYDHINSTWARSRSTLLRKIRKARRAGVNVVIALEECGWREYYDIYRESVKRWNQRPSYVYDYKLFDIMLHRQSPNIKLWLAITEGRAVAGALCFYAGKNVIYWHGAGLKEFFPLRPVNLLMAEIIRDGCLNGLSCFDFNPSGGLEGVINFKESFGAVRVRSNVYRKKGHVSAVAERILGRLQ